MRDVPERPSQADGSDLGGSQRHQFPAIVDHEPALRLPVEGRHRFPPPVVEEVPRRDAAKERLPRFAIGVDGGPEHHGVERLRRIRRSSSISGARRASAAAKYTTPPAAAGTMRVTRRPNALSARPGKPARQRGQGREHGQRRTHGGRAGAGDRGEEESTVERAEPLAEGDEEARHLERGADRERERESLHAHRIDEQEHEDDVRHDRDHRPDDRGPGVLHGIERPGQDVDHHVGGHADGEPREGRGRALGGFGA